MWCCYRGRRSSTSASDPRPPWSRWRAPPVSRCCAAMAPQTSAYSSRAISRGAAPPRRRLRVDDGGRPAHLVHAVHEERHEDEARREAHGAVEARVDVDLEVEHELEEHDERAPDEEQHGRAEEQRADQLDEELELVVAVARVDLCGNQPLVWVVLTKLENSLARSNRSRFG